MVMVSDGTKTTSKAHSHPLPTLSTAHFQGTPPPTREILEQPQHVCFSHNDSLIKNWTLIHYRMHLLTSIAVLISLTSFAHGWRLKTFPASRGGCFNEPSYDRISQQSSGCLSVDTVGYIDAQTEGSQMIEVYGNNKCTGRPVRVVESLPCTDVVSQGYKGIKMVVF